MTLPSVTPPTNRSLKSTLFSEVISRKGSKLHNFGDKISEVHIFSAEMVDFAVFRQNYPKMLEVQRGSKVVLYVSECPQPLSEGCVYCHLGAGYV